MQLYVGLRGVDDAKDQKKLHNLLVNSLSYVAHAYSAKKRWSRFSAMTPLALLRASTFTRKEVNNLLQEHCRDILPPRLLAKKGIISSYVWKQCCLGAAAAQHETSRMVFEQFRRHSGVFQMIQTELTAYLSEPGVLSEVCGSGEGER